MARESVKLTIDINQSDLEAEKLDELTQNLLQEMTSYIGILHRNLA